MSIDGVYIQLTCSGVQCAMQQPLCLEPNTDVVKNQNHIYYNSRKFNFVGNQLVYDLTEDSTVRCDPLLRSLM